MENDDNAIFKSGGEMIQAKTYLKNLMTLFFKVTVVETIH